MIYVFVGLAGALGALFRYSISISTASLWFFPFPLATLLANIIGCFMLGWFTTRIMKQNKVSKPLAAAMGTGLIGSFTTFSTFSVETVMLLEEKLIITALLYVVSSFIGGLLFAWFGYQLGRRREKSYD
ncbi:fluoride efflux transporter CrcB [Bacillus taeanensis]|uniref:Fluoride-specific ion channel FluC n=1 Tax=Bacillus taeanensis TaxID=273032 RepID=A0A366XRR8_9BACI|nr:fluoride efflux transporter CrcB [Bacillus taeanensis]RBW69060.1 fluoride efflux transporter CrcB [Bacillus taeanensis]